VLDPPLLSVPVKTQGGYASPAGFSVDLDTSAVTVNEQTSSDLTWRPNHSLKAVGTAGLTITGASFAA